MKKKKVATRDWALVRIIQGATKAGIHKDLKKEASRNACRKNIKTEESGLAPLPPLLELDEVSPSEIQSSSLEDRMQSGNIVFHKRLDKGPGVVLDRWTSDLGCFVRVLWQRELVELTHPSLSLTLSGECHDERNIDRKP